MGFRVGFEATLHLPNSHLNNCINMDIIWHKYNLKPTSYMRNWLSREAALGDNSRGGRNCWHHQLGQVRKDISRDLYKYASGRSERQKQCLKDIRSPVCSFPQDIEDMANMWEKYFWPTCATHHSEHNVHAVKHGSGNSMLWVCFCSAGNEKLVSAYRKMDGVKKKIILKIKVSSF